MKLAADIVDEVQGVFMWVRVVTDSLLVGLRHGDRISDLQKRLDQLPSDIESLYDRVLSMWDPFYFKHTAEYFQLMVTCTEPPPAPIFSYSDAVEYGDVRRALTNRKPWSVNPSSAVETIKRRLNSRCLGLLEVKERDPGGTNRREPPELNVFNVKIESGTRIDYLHRTVKDYVARADVQKRFQEAIGTFDTNLQLCFAWMAYATALPDTSPPQQDWLALRCIIHASKASSKSSSEVVQILNGLQRRIGLGTHNYSSTDFAYRVGTTSVHVDKGFLSLATRVGVTHYLEAWINCSQKKPQLDGARPVLSAQDLKITPSQLLLQAVLCPEPCAMIATVRLLLGRTETSRKLNIDIGPSLQGEIERGTLFSNL
jgi:hypothetical protein